MSSVGSAAEESNRQRARCPGRLAEDGSPHRSAAKMVAFPVRAARWSAPTAATFLCTIHHALALRFVYKPACGGGLVFCIIHIAHRRTAMRHQVGCAEGDRRAENIESAKGVPEHNRRKANDHETESHAGNRSTLQKREGAHFHRSRSIRPEDPSDAQISNGRSRLLPKATYRMPNHQNPT